MQSEVASGAEVLALGIEHLQPVGTVHHEQVAVCIRGEARRVVEPLLSYRLSLAPKQWKAARDCACDRSRQMKSRQGSPHRPV
jgi:hypothetical protein